MDGICNALNLGIRHLLNNFDEDHEGKPWFDMRLRFRKRAYLDHLGTLDLAHVPGRMIDALLYAEATTGFPIPADALDHIRMLLLESLEVGPCVSKSQDEEGNWQINFHDFREAMLALTALYRYRGDEEALALARRMIAQLTEWTNADGSWRKEHFPAGFRYGVDECPTCARGRLVGALVKFFQATADEQALALARIYAAYTREHSFTQEGALTDLAGTHIHSITSTVHALAQLGECTGDEDMLSMVERIMRLGLAPYTAYHGWVKELIGPPDMVGEVNSTGDLIQTALILADAGRHEYYSVAERMLRGFLLPSQIRSAMEIDPEWRRCDAHPTADRYADIENRMTGGFGFPSPTDRVQLHYEHPYARVTTLDITAGAMQALCECHARALRETESGWRLNLLLDRSVGPVRWMRINENEYSLCCEDGRSIWLRLPQGVAPDGVGLSVNGRVQTPTLDGEYVRVPGACDTSIWATVTLKAESQYRTEAILGHRYTICIRGEETVAIHPRGGIAPLF